MFPSKKCRELSWSEENLFLNQFPTRKSYKIFSDEIALVGAVDHSFVSVVRTIMLVFIIGGKF